MRRQNHDGAGDAASRGPGACDSYGVVALIARVVEPGRRLLTVPRASVVTAAVEATMEATVHKSVVVEAVMFEVMVVEPVASEESKRERRANSGAVIRPIRISIGVGVVILDIHRRTNRVSPRCHALRIGDVVALLQFGRGH